MSNTLKRINNFLNTNMNESVSGEKLQSYLKTNKNLNKEMVQIENVVKLFGNSSVLRRCIVEYDKENKTKFTNELDALKSRFDEIIELFDNFVQELSYEIDHE